LQCQLHLSMYNAHDKKVVLECRCLSKFLQNESYCCSYSEHTAPTHLIVITRTLFVSTHCFPLSTVYHCGTLNYCARISLKYTTVSKWMSWTIFETDRYCSRIKWTYVETFRLISPKNRLPVIMIQVNKY
jgi:hypothetical protein